MTLSELLARCYEWSAANALFILIGALVYPSVATVASWIGKKAKSAQAGRAVASIAVGGAIILLAIELAAVSIAQALLGKSVLSADVLLLLAPPVCAALTILGIRLVFPLGELGSIQTARDIALFFVACAVALWLLSKFRGWGVIFLGGLTQLVTVGLFSWFLLRRLFRRAFGRDEGDPVG